MAFMSKESFSEFDQRKHREFMEKYTTPIKHSEDNYSKGNSNAKLLLNRIDNLERKIKSLESKVERLSEENSSLHAKMYLWEPMLASQYAMFTMKNPYDDNND